MKIGILGAGTVGQSFAKAVLPLGHEVMLSSRQPDSDKMRRLAAELGVSVGTIAETVAFGEVLPMALRWDAVADVVSQGQWADKIVIDMMNRFGSSTGLSTSQELAQKLPDAHIVKALNTIGAEHYQNPVFDGQAATMFIAGDSSDAKSIVADILTQMRFEVIDIGDLTTVHHLESLAALWVHLAMRTDLGRNVAFKLLKR